MDKKTFFNILDICYTKCTNKNFIYIFILNVIECMFFATLLLKINFLISVILTILFYMIVDIINRYIFVYYKHRGYYLIYNALDMLFDRLHEGIDVHYNGAFVMDYNVILSDLNYNKAYCLFCYRSALRLYQKGKISKLELSKITDKYNLIRKFINIYVRIVKEDISNTNQKPNIELQNFIENAIKNSSTKLEALNKILEFKSKKYGIKRTKININYHKDFEKIIDDILRMELLLAKGQYKDIVTEETEMERK